MNIFPFLFVTLSRGEPQLSSRGAASSSSTPGGPGLGPGGVARGREVLPSQVAATAAKAAVEASALLGQRQPCGRCPTRSMSLKKLHQHLGAPVPHSLAPSLPQHAHWALTLAKERGAVCPTRLPPDALLGAALPYLAPGGGDSGAPCKLPRSPCPCSESGHRGLSCSGPHPLIG